MIIADESKTIHHLLVAALEDQILAGNIAPGEMFWPYERIMREFRVSDNTVTKARNALVERAVLKKIRGVGTRVTPDAIQHIKYFRTAEIQSLLKNLLEKCAMIDLTWPELMQMTDEYFKQVDADPIYENTPPFISIRPPQTPPPSTPS